MVYINYSFLHRYLLNAFPSLDHFQENLWFEIKNYGKESQTLISISKIQRFHFGESEFSEIYILKPGIKNEGTMLSKANNSVSCVYFVIAVNKCLCKFHLQKSENRLKSVLFTIGILFIQSFTGGSL